MIVAVPRERAPGETRVALTPDAARRAARDGVEFRLESGAGRAAGYSDDEYREVGVALASSEELYRGADVVFRVGPPWEDELDDGRSGPAGGGPATLDRLPGDSVLMGFLRPRAEPERLEALADRGLTAFALELVPRISRAQSMDALSSMATVAGYKATLLAASSVGKFFPMLTTAAGTVRPARVLILGAGVAGLQAIATSRRLGARVEAFDIRPEVKEQVESLGAEFLELEDELGEGAADEEGYAEELSEEKQALERELVAEHAAKADAVITTANVPGRKAPVLLSRETVERMQPGSAVVDLAAESGGNCELTRPGESVEHGGVVIHGPLNLPASLPYHASQMYARNLTSLLGLLAPDGRLELDFDDQVVDACCVAHDGTVRYEP